MEQLTLFKPTRGEITLKDLESNHYRPIGIVAMDYHLSGIEIEDPVSIDDLNSFFAGQEDLMHGEMER